jgi:site-specific recombinase XerC
MIVVPGLSGVSSLSVCHPIGTRRGVCALGTTSPTTDRAVSEPVSITVVSNGDRIRSLRDGVMTAARRAKLPAGWHLHDLRHRRVTAWLAEGKNPVHVREAVGHSDLRTTMGYTHLAREHLRSLVEAPPAAAPGRAGSA